MPATLKKQFDDLYSSHLVKRLNTSNWYEKMGSYLRGIDAKIFNYVIWKIKKLSRPLIRGPTEYTTTKQEWQKFNTCAWAKYTYNPLQVQTFKIENGLVEAKDVVQPHFWYSLSCYANPLVCCGSRHTWASKFWHFKPMLTACHS